MVVCHISVTSFKSPLEACGVGGEGKKGENQVAQSHIAPLISFRMHPDFQPRPPFQNSVSETDAIACRLPEEPRVPKAVGRTAAFTSCTVQCVFLLPVAHMGILF